MGQLHKHPNNKITASERRPKLIVFSKQIFKETFLLVIRTIPVISLTLNVLKRFFGAFYHYFLLISFRIDY